MQNLSVSVYILSVILFYCIEDVSMQAIAPIGYGSSPIVYSQSDDDLGMLLTILLLAGRNRNCNGKCGQTCSCCNCCNCGGDSSQNIPIPYPIPFPTNNPIINRRDHFYDDSDEDDHDDEDEDKHKKYIEDSDGFVKEVKSKVKKPDYNTDTDNSVTTMEEAEEKI